MYIGFCCLLLVSVISTLVVTDSDYGIVFYPTDGKNQDHVDQVTLDLQAIIEPARLFVSFSRYLGTFYWFASMTVTRAETFANARRGLVSYPSIQSSLSRSLWTLQLSHGLEVKLILTTADRDFR